MHQSLLLYMYGLGCCCNTECEVDSTKHTCRGTLPMAPDQKLGIKLSHDMPGFRQGRTVLRRCNHTCNCKYSTVHMFDLLQPIFNVDLGNHN